MVVAERGGGDPLRTPPFFFGRTEYCRSSFEGHLIIFSIRCNPRLFIGRSLGATIARPLLINSLPLLPLSRYPFMFLYSYPFLFLSPTVPYLYLSLSLIPSQTQTHTTHRSESDCATIPLPRRRQQLNQCQVVDSAAAAAAGLEAKEA